MVDAQTMQEVRRSEDELNQERVLGLSETIDVTDLLLSARTDRFDIRTDEYDEFQEELRMIDFSAAQLGRELGLGKNTVYSWKKWGVPQYAWAYLQLKCKLHDITGES